LTPRPQAFLGALGRRRRDPIRCRPITPAVRAGQADPGAICSPFTPTASDTMTTRTPQTEHGKRVREQVSDQRWRRIVSEADERAAVVDAVVALHDEGGISWRQAVAKVASDLPWPSFVHHKRHYEARPGPTWERLLDGRAPPDTSIPQDVEITACLLRQLDPDIGVAAARKHLIKRFGEDKGHVSDTWLKRVWHDAGLNRPAGATSSHGAPGMATELFHGGAGLALLGAAEAEVGTTLQLAHAILAAGEQRVKAQDTVEAQEDADDRDDRGRFTADYNARRRLDTKPGDADQRWGTDADKATRRNLATIATVRHKPGTLASKLLAMGATPLLTERRGFDGLDGPSGEWLGVLGETHAGAVSLKKRLLPVLEKLDRAIGPSADVGRLTLVDSELGTAGCIWAMHDQTEMLFVTVLKGAVLKGAAVSDEGRWQSFRERDQVRDVEVHLRGKDAPEEGIRVRGVQMRRGDGRRPQTTLFATNASAEDLPPSEVAAWYLGRWPKQEQKFATGRNGGGLNRSHGYGGAHVEHVALEGKLGRAERSVRHSARRRELAEQVRDDLAEALVDAPAKARKQALTLAHRAVADREKAQQRSKQAKARVDTLPGDIYVRDTGRDSVMTCLKLNVLSLLEFVMQEYFGGVGMHWRTFIEQFVGLPVEVRSNKRRCVYVIKANRRQPERMAQLRRAVDEVNRRKIRRGKQVLVFEIEESAAG